VAVEEALRASEERFAGIFRQTSVGVVQCGLDGRFLLANKRFCDIAARTETELRPTRPNTGRCRSRRDAFTSNGRNATTSSS
jgi:PAS domain-containing protein